MRVLHVIDTTNRGGTERQCVELARGLSGAGIQNAVFCFRVGPLEADLGSIAEVLQIRVGSFRSIRFPNQLIRLAHAMRGWAPDVVQTYGFYGNVPGLLAATFARVPVRVASRRDLGAHLRPAQRWADREVWRFAHCIVVNSDAVRAQLVEEQGVAGFRVAVIRNGLNLRVWQGSGHDPGDIGDGPVVGMVANFRYQKDHGTFLKAARQILKEVPSSRFVLVGSGPLEGEVRELAGRLGVASHVEFAGSLGGEALRVALGRFHVSVLTSKNNEGLPNVLLESMAMGVPVVATMVGGAVEVIEDGVTGFLVPSQSPSAVSEHVLRILRDPSLARRMGRQGRNKVEREFTIERMVSEFHQLYEGLLMKRTRWKAW